MGEDLTHIMSGRDRSARGRLARLGLRVLSPPYRLAVGGRNGLFDTGLRHAARLPRPTIAVGNLTAGGTGKTPLTLDLARRLIGMGHRPAILLRGYKASAGQSDEAALYQQALASEPGPPAVVAHASRRAGAAQALRQAPDTDGFLLDDAFQHRQVDRDLELVLIDATCPFGHGYLLPRGLLREPIGNLKRADAVIVTRCDQVSEQALGELDATIARLTGEPPIAHVAHQWTALREGEGPAARSLPIDTLANTTVAGACGIGNPEAFERTLRSRAEVVWCEQLNDHAVPSASWLMSLLERAKRDGAAAMVTTEKDWVKWAPMLADHSQLPIPIRRAAMTLDWREGAETIQRLLRSTMETTYGRTLN